MDIEGWLFSLVLISTVAEVDNCLAEINDRQSM